MVLTNPNHQIIGGVRCIDRHHQQIPGIIKVTAVPGDDVVQQIVQQHHQQKTSKQDISRLGIHQFTIENRQGLQVRMKRGRHDAALALAHEVERDHLARRKYQFEKTAGFCRDKILLVYRDKGAIHLGCPSAIFR